MHSAFASEAVDGRIRQQGVGLLQIRRAIPAALQGPSEWRSWLALSLRLACAALCVLLVGCGPWVARGYMDLLAPRNGVASPTTDATRYLPSIVVPQSENGSGGAVGAITFSGSVIAWGKQWNAKIGLPGL